MGEITQKEYSVKTQQLILRMVIGILAAAPAFAQDFPAKPVRMIVGFPPGGATDLVARILQPPMSAGLGKQVIVDNRPGANGVDFDRYPVALRT